MQKSLKLAAFISGLLCSTSIVSAQSHTNYSSLLTAHQASLSKAGVGSKHKSKKVTKKNQKKSKKQSRKGAVKRKNAASVSKKQMNAYIKLLRADVANSNNSMLATLNAAHTSIKDAHASISAVKDKVQKSADNNMITEEDEGSMPLARYVQNLRLSSLGNQITAIKTTISGKDQVGVDGEDGYVAPVIGLVTNTNEVLGLLKGTDATNESNETQGVKDILEAIKVMVEEINHNTGA